MLYFAFDKVKLFSANFPIDSNLEDPRIFLPVIASRTKVKEHNVPATPKLIYQRLLTGFSMLFVFANANLMEFQVKHLGLFCLFPSYKRLQVVLDGKSLQEHPVNTGAPLDSIIGLLHIFPIMH